jgi:Spy/CpxP family protein refolding chaperone
MRRYHVFGFALALAAASSAQDAAAQQQPRGQHEQHAAEGRRQGGRQERLFQGITLSDAQRQQIRAIFQEGRPERGDRAARPQGERGQRAEGQRGERPQLTEAQRAELQKRRAEFQARRQQQIARVRAVLTAEQRTQFDRNLAQAEAQRGKRGERGERRQGGRQS